jgi:hypothetical protein
VPGTVRQALLAVGHALRGVRPAGFAAVARLRALPSAGPGTPFGPRRPRCARGSPRRLRRRGPAPGLALRRPGNPVRASSATVCAGFAPAASPPWPGSGLRPPPAREPRSGSVGYGRRGVRPAGFAAVARLRAFALRRLGNPVRASSATVCAGFAPPASPPWPGSGLRRPPPAREPRSGIRRPRSCAGFAPPASPPWPGSGLRPPPAREPRSGLVGHGRARGSPRRLRRRGPAPDFVLRRPGNPAGGGLPSQARSTRLNVQPGRAWLAPPSPSGRAWHAHFSASEGGWTG